MVTLEQARQGRDAKCFHEHVSKPTKMQKALQTLCWQVQ
jgi:hypothetical protein